MGFFKGETTLAPEGEPPTTPPAEAPDLVPAASRGMSRLRLLLLIAVCAVNAALSGLLLLQHHGEGRAVAAVSQVCGEGAESGCDKVAQSRFAQFRGMPLGGYGLVVYGSLALLLALALLAGPETRAAAGAVALLVLTLALAVDVALFGIQLVAIRAFCKVCLLTYAIGALGLVIALPARRDGRVLGEALVRPDGRLAFTGWALATVAAGMAVFAGETALDLRERERARAVLGTVTSGAPVAPSVAPPTPLSGPATAADATRFQEEARVATEQARRLQEILDDPRKLDQYFAEKAAREFEQGPVHALKLDASPYKGPAQAPVRVTEFSDFLCPYCRNVAIAFGSYVPSMAGRVSVYFKNYPLDAECNPNVKPTIHPGACRLARAGLCAHEQGRFWPFHDRIFSAPITDAPKMDLTKLAGEVGLDTAAFAACVDAPRIQDRLAAEIAEGKQSGVDATPTLFVNGKRLPRLTDLSQTVDKETAKLGLPPLPPPQN